MTNASIVEEQVSAAATRGGLGGLLAARWYLPVCSAFLVVALWAICRPYLGIIHDSRIYLGRALADLDPTSLGRQIDYAHDGQNGFTIFPNIVAAGVTALGPSVAMITLTAVGLAAWLAAAAWLLSRYFEGAALLGALICLCGFPATYGAYGVFRWAEPFATPRIFAEAFGLCALAMLSDRRNLVAMAFLLAAATFHPLMAIPIAAAGFVVLVLEDSRRLFLAPAGLLCLLAAAAVHLPVAGRLFESFDKAWLGIIAPRGPYLFPNLWTGPSWALLGCQVASLWLALRVVEPKLRRIVLGAALAGLFGVAATLAAPTVLIVQLQVWRGLWRASFFAASTFAPVATQLLRRGVASSTALAALVLAWMTRDLPVVSLAASLVAVVASVAPSPAGSAGRVLTGAAWLLAAIATAGWLAIRVTAILNVIASAPEGGGPSLSLATNPILAVIASLLGVVIAARKVRLSRGTFRAIYGIAAATAFLGALLIWDQRSIMQRFEDNGTGGQQLMGEIRGGTVLWLDDSGMDWLRTRRPYWWSDLEGAETVFDRNLSLEWYRRLTFLISIGLASKQDGVLTGDPKARPDDHVTLSAVRQLCSAVDHPDWLVTDRNSVEPAFRQAARYVWRAPTPEFKRTPDLRTWKVVRDFTVFSCADFETSG